MLGIIRYPKNTSIPMTSFLPEVYGKEDPDFSTDKAARGCSV